jgi:hypothetical protein
LSGELLGYEGRSFFDNVQGFPDVGIGDERWKLQPDVSWQRVVKLLEHPDSLIGVIFFPDRSYASSK